MNLSDTSWKKFLVSEIFDILNGSGLTKDEVSEHPGNVPAVQSGEENSGILGYINLDYAVKVGYTYTTSRCLTVARSGTAGSVHYFPHGCVIGDSAKILLAKDNISEKSYLFLQTILEQLKYKYSYGRKVTEEKYKQEVIALPTTTNGTPNWEWIDNFISTLHHREITTTNSPTSVPDLTSERIKWGDFQVGELFDVVYGINMELNACTETSMHDPEAVAFVARTSENNGISAYVKPVKGKIPQPPNTITVAGGGSVLSTFLQTRPFYSGRDLYLLQEKQPISNSAKLFVITELQAEKYRFNYGRQANRTLPHLNLHLPIDKDGNPNWQWMESYIDSLPFGDRIPDVTSIN